MKKNYNFMMEDNRIDEVFALFANHPIIQYGERYIAQAVENFGETKEMHIYYLSLITSTVLDIIEANNHELARCIVSPFTNYTKFYAVEICAGILYQTRKNSIGLKTHSVSTRDFCFNEVTEKCVMPINRARLAELMEQICIQTEAVLSSLELATREIVITPFMMVHEDWAFYKILDKVMVIVVNSELTKVEGVGIWAVIVAAYEIAHRIHDNYEKSIKEEEIA